MRKLVIISGLLLMPVVASAATPPEGVPLKVRRGFFTETDIGGFLTLGGADGYSNLQIYLQLGVGYDITENIEIGLHVGIGANAANCYAQRNAKGNCVNGTASTATDAPDNFTMTFVDATFAYLFRIAERLYVAPKVIGGLTFLEPAPLEDGNGNPISIAGNVGLGVGVEYATNMDHFTIGLDVSARYILSANIFSLGFFPRVKYTF